MWRCCQTNANWSQFPMSGVSRHDPTRWCAKHSVAPETLETIAAPVSAVNRLGGLPDGVDLMSFHTLGRWVLGHHSTSPSSGPLVSAPRRAFARGRLNVAVGLEPGIRCEIHQ